MSEVGQHLLHLRLGIFAGDVASPIPASDRAWVRRRLSSLRHEPEAEFHYLHQPTLLGARCRFAAIGSLRNRVAVVTAEVRHDTFFAHLEFGDRLVRQLQTLHGASVQFHRVGFFGTQEVWCGAFGQCVAASRPQRWMLTYQA